MSLTIELNLDRVKTNHCVPNIKVRGHLVFMLLTVHTHAPEWPLYQIHVIRYSTAIDTALLQLTKVFGAQGTDVMSAPFPESRHVGLTPIMVMDCWRIQQTLSNSLLPSL